MKKLLTPALLITGLLALTGCGGSGTPLPQAPKKATIFFIPTSTARTLPISAYVYNTIKLPGSLTIPLGEGNSINGSDISGFNSLNPQLPSDATPSGSFFADFYPDHDGKIEALTMLANPNNDLGFRHYLKLICNLNDHSLTKQAVFDAYSSRNPKSSRVANASQGFAGDLNAQPIPVFYNISVSIQ